MCASLCQFRVDQRSVLILGVLVCVLNPWGLVGYLRFELSYAKPTRRHLCQLDVVFVLC